METALTIRDVALILKISESQLYRLVATNKVPFFKVGRAIRFLPSELEKFMRGEWKAQEGAGAATQRLFLYQRPTHPRPLAALRKVSMPRKRDTLRYEPMYKPSEVKPARRKRPWKTVLRKFLSFIEGQRSIELKTKE